MNMDMSHALLSIEGEVLVDARGPVTVRRVCVNALLGSFEGDSKLSGEEKYDRYALACEVQQATTMAFTPEQVVLLKRLIPMGYPIVIAGQMEALFRDAD